MQGTRVPSLVWEEPTSHRATKPVCHTTEAQTPRAGALQPEKPLEREAQALQRGHPCSPQPEKAPAQHEDPEQSKIKWIHKKKLSIEHNKALS